MTDSPKPLTVKFLYQMNYPYAIATAVLQVTVAVVV